MPALSIWLPQDQGLVGPGKHPDVNLAMLLR